jgi:hypothetical protein
MEPYVPRPIYEAAQRIVARVEAPADRHDLARWLREEAERVAALSARDQALLALRVAYDRGVA